MSSHRAKQAEITQMAILHSQAAIDEAVYRVAQYYRSKYGEISSMATEQLEELSISSAHLVDIVTRDMGSMVLKFRDIFNNPQETSYRTQLEILNISNDIATAVYDEIMSLINSRQAPKHNSNTSNGVVMAITGSGDVTDVTQLTAFCDICGRPRFAHKDPSGPCDFIAKTA